MNEIILSQKEKRMLISLHRTLKNKKQADKVKSIILLSYYPKAKPKSRLQKYYLLMKKLFIDIKYYLEIV